mmetsp:Transcript_41045/g.95841  ORF Transcript_41045/g.95841 Transcript_41045/m.95841 type:complete len:265 (-) Transcript_41045:289-1083(-)
MGPALAATESQLKVLVELFHHGCRPDLGELRLGGLLDEASTLVQSFLHDFRGHEGKDFDELLHHLFQLREEIERRHNFHQRVRHHLRKARQGACTTLLGTLSNAKAKLGNGGNGSRPLEGLFSKVEVKESNCLAHQGCLALLPSEKDLDAIFVCTGRRPANIWTARAEVKALCQDGHCCLHGVDHGVCHKGRFVCSLIVGICHEAQLARHRVVQLPHLAAAFLLGPLLQRLFHQDRPFWAQLGIRPGHGCRIAKSVVMLVRMLV